MVGVLPSDREIFPSADALGVPLLKAEDFEPSYLVSHRQKVRTEYPLSGGAVYFFLNDGRFEPVWKTPRKGLSYVEGVGAALTPDFSVDFEPSRRLTLWQSVCVRFTTGNPRAAASASRRRFARGRSRSTGPARHGRPGPTAFLVGEQLFDDSVDPLEIDGAVTASREVTPHPRNDSHLPVGDVL